MVWSSCVVPCSVNSFRRCARVPVLWRALPDRPKAGDLLVQFRAPDVCDAARAAERSVEPLAHVHRHVAEPAEVDHRLLADECRAVVAPRAAKPHIMLHHRTANGYCTDAKVIYSQLVAAEVAYTHVR